MTYPHAYKGVKKLFIAQILTLVAGLAYLVSTVIVAVITNNVEMNAEELAKNPGYAIPVLCAGVLAVVAAVISLIGLIQGGKDERYFRYAVYMVFAGIIVTVVKMILNSEGTLIYGILDTAGSLFEIFETIFVVYGIVMLSGRLGNMSGVFAGKRVLNIIVAIYVLIFIMNVLEMIFGKGSSITEIESILSIVVSVLTVAGYVLYLVLLGKATKILKNN